MQREKSFLLSYQLALLFLKQKSVAQYVVWPFGRWDQGRVLVRSWNGKCKYQVKLKKTLLPPYYLLNWLCVKTRPSRRIGNFTSQLPTMFWILKSRNFACDNKLLIIESLHLQKWKLTGKPNFWTIRAYFLAANLESSSDLAPVHTIFPELKMRAVVLGSRILIITAAKRLGLYSALRAWRAIFLRSNLHPRLTVETMFLKVNMNVRHRI